MSKMFKIGLTIVFIYLVCYRSRPYASPIRLKQNNDALLAFNIAYGIHTMVQITCDDFISELDGDFRTNVITNADSLYTFKRHIEKTIYLNKGYSMDVRAKFIYISNEKRLFTICTDGKELMLNGRLIAKDTSFLSFLNSIIFKAK